jgi:DNA-binding response OmpR family regulator
METVLIIEDDSTMLRGLKDNFEFQGYGVLTAVDGEEGLNAALNKKPDLIILDIMLPKINGYEICRLIRKEKLEMPIIMLTAKGEADYKLDIGARKLTHNASEIKLSPREFRLLELFVTKPGRALTRDEILNVVWGYDCFVSPRSVDRFVTTLRNKIEPDPHNPIFISTIREIGYKFEPPEQDN